MCKEGLLVDPAKIAAIVDMPAPTSVKELRATLGHIGRVLYKIDQKLC